MARRTAICPRPAINKPLNLASTAAVLSMLVCPLAWSAPGDLDPAFGDVGRVTDLPGLVGDVWSIEPHGNAFVLGGGGVISTDPENSLPFGFTRRIARDGSIDSTYSSAIPQDMTVYDVVVHSNGQVIGVGSGFTAVRLTASGALDATFGDGGFAHGPPDLELSTTSVLLDDSARAVIAGRSGRRLVVLRLLPNGDIDETFGDAGVFMSGDTLNAFFSRPRILRVPDGYRVMLNTSSSFEPPSRPVVSCLIVALRDDGVLETTFGASGLAALSRGASCTAFAAQPDSRLVVAGRRGGQAFAVRLLASGEPDADFNAEDATARISVTAMAGTSDGSLYLAGHGEAGVPGTLVVRLQKDGTLDRSFGADGEAWIDVPTSTGGSVARDIRALADGSIALAGSVSDNDGVSRPFVARLLGNTGRGGPGVVGVKHLLVDATSNPNQAVVTVRRTGGGAGAISVAYRTWTNPDVTMPAMEGQDYVATSGRLTWADGNSEDKEIVVPLLGDIDGNPDNDRTFEVQLSDVQGGGLGSLIATVNTGFPAAVLQIDPTDLTVSESQGTVSLNMNRGSNFEGAVAVTLTASAGTATAGSDYRFEPMTVEWADGDSSAKTITIPIIDDDGEESSESFSISITGATNGAVISTPVATITINDDDQSDNSGGGNQSGSSGGGQFGLFSMILLGFAGAFRAVRHRGSTRL